MSVHSLVVAVLLAGPYAAVAAQQPSDSAPIVHGIDRADLDLFHVTDNVDEAADYLQKCEAGQCWTRQRGYQEVSKAQAISAEGTRYGVRPIVNASDAPAPATTAAPSRSGDHKRRRRSDKNTHKFPQS